MAGFAKQIVCFVLAITIEGAIKLLHFSKLFLLALCLSATLLPQSLAADRFVVIDVKPIVTDITAGTQFESDEKSPEFIYVPSGVAIVLLGEDGSQYLIAGPRAIKALKGSLKAHLIDPASETAGCILRVFLRTPCSLTILAGGRNLKTEGVAENPVMSAIRPLPFDNLDNIKGRTRFCIFANALELRRGGTRFVERIAVEVGGVKAEKNWPDGSGRLIFESVDIQEGQAKMVKFTGSIQEHRLEIVRLTASAIGNNLVANVAVLLRNGCVLQALTIVEDSVPSGQQ